jgi:branched-chain amino acid transport system ATP-binding protein
MVNGQLKADQGSILLDGNELVGQQAARHLAPGRGPHLPDRRDLRVAHRGRERADGACSRTTASSSRCGAARPTIKRDDALVLLDQVGMKLQADRPCSELAYGDVKRVELAIAMANEPKLLLMDEPTAGMAPKERNSLMALTKDLVIQRGMAVLFTEHSMDVVFAYADRMIVLARGRLIAQGKPLEIRDHPKVQEVYFGSGKTFEKIAEKAAEVNGRVGRNGMSTHETVAERRIAVCAWYGAAQILYDVDLEVRRGEVVALMGRNGAGKSTTLKTLIGMLAKRKRRRELPRPRHFEERAAPWPRKLGLGFVPEDRRVFTDLTVTENLEVGKQPRAALEPTAPRRRCGRPSGCSSCSPTSARCPTDRAGA